MRVARCQVMGSLGCPPAGLWCFVETVNCTVSDCEEVLSLCQLLNEVPKLDLLSATAFKFAIYPESGQSSF
jgi:hypothetical protein